jgi:hypothetical protein
LTAITTTAAPWVEELRKKVVRLKVVRGDTEI